MSVFVNYIQDQTPLWSRIEDHFKRLRVERERKKVIVSFLRPLRDKGPVYKYHYDHTLRVALLCVEVARFMHLDQKAMLYAGLLHDIGKVMVPADTLGKMRGWTEEDSRNIHPHVVDGYRMLHDKFDFTAEIILLHHKFQANGYPVELPPRNHPYCLGTQGMILMFGRILALCDQFDAFHRINDHGGTVTVPTGESIRESMFKVNPDQRVLLEELYQAGVFTTYTETLTSVA